MIAESTPDFYAVEAHGQKIMAAFRAAGAQHVAPAIIQPAGLFLDVVGESLRGRTYVFTDPDGLELCLRPDLTVPACRIYLERDPLATSEQRYCYSGPVFRYQPQDAPKANARETQQAGFESFGIPDRAAADAEVLTVTLKALRSAGLPHHQLRVGDLGLLHAILEAQAMPTRWRQRLAHQFWRVDAFRQELDRLVQWPAASAEGIDPHLLDRLDLDRPDEAEMHVAEYLATTGLDLFGTRQLGEITAGLLDAAADTRQGSLKPEHAELITNYLAISGTPAAAIDRLEHLAHSAGCDIAPAITTYRRRLALLGDAGLDLTTAHFSGEFGRRFEYYTGFVFEVLAPGLADKSPVAGGGRYDGLLKAVGAPHDVAAVGAAIYTERLRVALAGGAP